MAHLPAFITASLGKLTRYSIKITRQGRGETAPGLVALRLDSQFVRRTNHRVPTRVVISGTNGKTTTTTFARTLLKANQWSFVSNPTGSNLLRGIATASLDIMSKTQTVLWEVDEAALVPVCEQVVPTVLVLTNLFRDQLDRYGEIDTIFQKWLKALSSLPKTTLILNADDPSLAYLGSQLKQHNLIYFGLDIKNNQHTPEAAADAIFCPNCHKPLVYTHVHYSHLGDYHCACGFRRPKPTALFKDLKVSESTITGKVGPLIYQIPLTGMYNAYNLTATIALAQALHLDPGKVVQVLKTTEAAFGRQETHNYHGVKLTTILVKNPTGFNQVLQTLKALNKPLNLLIAINDKIADGTDVSWLWDVDFELLKSSVNHIIVSGERALDMGVRLKYADFNTTQYDIHPDLTQAVKSMAKKPNRHWYVLPTYTAMWALQKIMNK